MSVNYATVDGSAHAGQDYQAASGTLSFAAGETVKSFDVTTTDDSIFTGARNFTVALSGATNGYLISASPITFSIAENDFSILSFSSSTYTVSQSDAVATITVLRTGTVSHAVSVAYSTSSCCSNLPPVQSAAGTLNFAPGETSKSFSVIINQYDVFIGDANVSLNLFSPSVGATFSGCAVCNPSANLLVKDVHPRPMLAIDDASIFRGTSGTTLVPVTIRMSALSSLFPVKKRSAFSKFATSRRNSIFARSPVIEK